MVEAHAHPDDLPPELTPGPEAPQLFEGDPKRVVSTSRESSFFWPVVVVLLVAAGAAAYWLWWRGTAPPPVVPMTESAPAPAPAPPVEPAVRHPIEAVPQAEQALLPPPSPLPPLRDSDAMVADGISGVIGSDLFDKLVRRDDIVRRIVATVDNLPRHSVAPRLMPVNPIPGRFATEGSGESLTIAADNGARYAPYVRVGEAVDMKTLAALYVRFYPLFQEAYRDLGYPNGYFNDRLVEAIDDMLAAPAMTGPVRLTQPKVFYEYADPRLEQRSAGQKIMMRIGSDNAARVKAKLTEFRREIAGPHAKQP
jgi:hypothetical protein